MFTGIVTEIGAIEELAAQFATPARFRDCGLRRGRFRRGLGLCPSDRARRRLGLRLGLSAWDFTRGGLGNCAFLHRLRGRDVLCDNRGNRRLGILRQNRTGRLQPHFVDEAHRHAFRHGEIVRMLRLE